MAMTTDMLHTHGPEPKYACITQDEIDALRSRNKKLEEENKRLLECMPGSWSETMLKVCKELRATRRALLLMCAKRADAEAYVENHLADFLLRGGTSRAVDYHRFERDKWYKIAASCRAKAEEYK